MGLNRELIGRVLHILHFRILIPLSRCFCALIGVHLKFILSDSIHILSESFVDLDVCPL